MKSLIKPKSTIENGINQMIERYCWLRERLNGTSASSKEETVKRLKMMEEMELLQGYLKILNIQDFELKEEEFNFKIN